jgi:hypothetical protein
MFPSLAPGTRLKWCGFRLLHRPPPQSGGSDSEGAHIDLLVPCISGMQHSVLADAIDQNIPEGYFSTDEAKI